MVKLIDRVRDHRRRRARIDNKVALVQWPDFDEGVHVGPFGSAGGRRVIPALQKSRRSCSKGGRIARPCLKNLMSIATRSCRL
jgi:hypothetical protein